MSIRARLSSFLPALSSRILPPCKGAVVFFWLCFIFILVTAGSHPLRKGNLPDSDGYMYLVQSIDWLNGQDWFDRLQHRMDPPQGVYIHFSHLLSAFYACIIYLLKPFSDLITAAWLTAVIIPAIYFALFLLSMRQLTRHMVTPAWGDFSAYIVFFFPGLLFQFQLGHLDHHGLEALLALISFYTALRGIECPHAILAGPFHTNRDGNLDALAFFSARDPDQAQAIAKKRQADLIVICDLPSQLRAYSRAAADAKAAQASTFIQQLIHGQIPDWLKQIQSPVLGHFILFEIQPLS